MISEPDLLPALVDAADRLSLTRVSCKAKRTGDLARHATADRTRSDYGSVGVLPSRSNAVYGTRSRGIFSVGHVRSWHKAD